MGWAGWQRFTLYDDESKRMLAKRLPVPAYDQLLKCSHAFNVLDARGAVGVTERATFFARMRTLARECAGLWLERREELGFPLGTVPSLQVRTRHLASAPRTTLHIAPLVDVDVLWGKSSLLHC
jgi:glycyl-tRNA synthetase